MYHITHQKKLPLQFPSFISTQITALPCGWHLLHGGHLVLQMTNMLSAHCLLQALTQLFILILYL